MSATESRAPHSTFAENPGNVRIRMGARLLAQFQHDDPVQIVFLEAVKDLPLPEPGARTARAKLALHVNKAIRREPPAHDADRQTRLCKLQP
jgi:hypothetical protein